MTSKDYFALRNAVALHEALRLLPYTDTVGKLTIGYGRNLTDNGIRQSEASVLLDNDLQDGIVHCEQLLPTFAVAGSQPQRALGELMFMLGVHRFLGFRKMIACVATGDWDGAAREVIASELPKQVGMARVQYLVSLLRSQETATR